MTFGSDPSASPGLAARHSDQPAWVDREERDRVIVAAVRGEIDLSNAAQLAREFFEIPNTALGLVVDIEAVDYLDSTAIALLYELLLRLERRGQHLVIVAPAGGSPRRVLELAAFDKQATLAEEVDAAVAAVRAAGGGPDPD